MSELLKPILRPLLAPLASAITAALGGSYAAIINDAGELAPYVTFTRSSTATRYNSAGLLETVASNAPRYDYDPTTVTLANLIKYSEEFGAFDWIKIEASIGSNVSLSPDGTLTADNLVPSTGNLTHYAYQTFVFTNGATYTFSVYAKAGGYNRFMIREGTHSGIYATFDVLTGTVISNNSTTANITPVGNGWYRCDMTITANGFSGNSVMAILNMPNNGSVYANATFSGNGTDGVLLWGAQFQTGSVATAYIKTTSSPAGNATLRGLLIEEQRTNLMVRSAEFDNASWLKTEATVTANSAVAPDGTLTADKFIPSTNALAHYLGQAGAAASGTNTFSVYAKKDGYDYLVLLTPAGNVSFNLATGAVANAGALPATIQNVGNGWYRCSMTATLPLGATVYISGGSSSAASFFASAGDGTSGIFIWGAQLEAGTFATSYIPTTTAAVTRAADNAVISSMASIGFNNVEGSIYTEFDVVAVNTTRRTMVYATSDTGFNRLALRASDVTTSNPVGAIGTGSIVESLVGTPITANTPVRIAMAYGSSMGYSQNGSAPLTRASAAAVGGSSFTLGSFSGDLHLNGHIRRLRYYNRRLSNAQLQALTV